MFEFRIYRNLIYSKLEQIGRKPLYEISGVVSVINLYGAPARAGTHVVGSCQTHSPGLSMKPSIVTKVWC